MTLSSNPQPSRRRFLGSLALGGAALALGSRSLHATSRELSRITGAGPVTLPPLPYKEDALDPVISARTIGFHYGKHHAGYVRKLNAVIRDTDWEEWSLEKIVTESHKKMDKDAKMRGVFNNAAQIWNHTFYWESMRPAGGGKPEGAVLEAIEESFGSWELFRAQFLRTAGGQFGSGWGWLVLGEKNKLELISTSNADLPVVHGKKPLMTVDVWEHAYYLDWQKPP
jgi:Fe-Mn family superoxide dismutase